jgi:hypothetical protein
MGGIRLAWGLLAYDADAEGLRAGELDMRCRATRGSGRRRISGRIDRSMRPRRSPVFVIDYKSGTRAYGPRFAAKGSRFLSPRGSAGWWRVMAGGARGTGRPHGPRPCARTRRTTSEVGLEVLRRQAALDMEIEACFGPRAAAEGVRLGRVPASRTATSAAVVRSARVAHPEGGPVGLTKQQLRAVGPEAGVRGRRAGTGRPPARCRYLRVAPRRPRHRTPPRSVHAWRRPRWVASAQTARSGSLRSGVVARLRPLGPSTSVCFC